MGKVTDAERDEWVGSETTTKDAGSALLDMMAGVSMGDPATPMAFDIDGAADDDLSFSYDDDDDDDDDDDGGGDGNARESKEGQQHAAPATITTTTAQDAAAAPKKSAFMQLFEKLDRKRMASQQERASAAQTVAPAGAPPSPISTDDTTGGATARVSSTRPPSLPPKSEDEEKRHLKMHEQLVRDAQKREEKKLSERRQRRDVREKHMAEWTAIWVNEIIPKWSIKSQEHRTRQLWKQGLPPKVRGTVWALGVGNQLNITDDLYNICLKRARLALQSQTSVTSSTSTVSTDSQSPTVIDPNSPLQMAGAGSVGREDTVSLIGTDLNRTYPSLGIFQPGGPLYEPLREVLMAYVCYRPDIGYMQGMSFLAAMLLINMADKDAFKALCNLLNRQCHMSFFQLDMDKISGYKLLLTKLIQEYLPVTNEIFTTMNISVDIFMYEWVLTLFAKSLPLEVSSRIWDRYILQGDRFLFRVCLGVLHLLEKKFIDQPFESIAYDLTHLPQDIEVEEFFVHVDSIHISKPRFAALHAAVLPNVPL